MPLDGCVGEGSNGLNDAVHGGGGPVEQVGEDGADRGVPKECPPEDAGEHEEIYKGKEQEVGQ